MYVYNLYAWVIKFNCWEEPPDVSCVCPRLDPGDSPPSLVSLVDLVPPRPLPPLMDVR